MITNINSSYFQLYSAIVLGANLLDAGFSIYRFNNHKHGHPTKFALAIVQTFFAIFSECLI